jgi:hypothetical protein
MRNSFNLHNDTLLGCIIAIQIASIENPVAPEGFSQEFNKEQISGTSESKRTRANTAQDASKLQHKPDSLCSTFARLRVENTTGNYATTKPQGDKLRQYVFCLLELFELHVQLKTINSQSDRSRFPRHEKPQRRVHSTRSCY